MVQLNLTEDEDYNDEENPLDFLGIIEASEGTMEMSFNDTRVDDSILMDVNEVCIPSQNCCVCVHNILAPQKQFTGENSSGDSGSCRGRECSG